MTRKLIFLIFLILLAFLFLMDYSANRFLDWLWFNSLDLTEVFWTPLLTGFFTKLILGLIFFLFLFFNLKSTGRAFMELNSDLNMTGRRHRIISTLLSLTLTVFLLSGVSYDWTMIQQAVHRTPVGTTDPIFGLDLSFYLFIYPLLHKLYLLTTSLIVLCFFAVAVSYLLARAYWYQENHFQLWPRARIHLTILGVCFLVAKAGGYWLNRFTLLFTENSLITGVDFTAHHVRIFGSNLLIGIALSAAALLVWSIFGKRYMKLLIAAGGLWLTVSFLVGAVPGLVENFYVKPNQYLVEERYIANHLKMTRFGYGLDRIKEKTFTPQTNGFPADITSDHPSLLNLRIWDYRPLLPVYNQLQTIRPYYTFHDIDIDRYKTADGQRQVMLAVREIDPAGLPPGANNWLNLHLTYTHGYGLVMNAVNEITPEGQPRFVVKDLPPKVDPAFPEVVLTRPEVYFGEVNQDYLVVKTKQAEFDYPLGDGNKTNTYQGKDGIPLRRLSIRTFLALKLRERNLLLSGYISKDSRLLLHRRIQDRVKKLAPFLGYDEDPYPVVADGQVYWLLDAYTSSSYLPYAKKHKHGFNYIRNSIKVVIDAYNGTVDFYLVDREDAIAQTWQKIYPRLIKDFDKMPTSLKKHIRYSERLFTIQRDMLLTYHLADPQAFYKKEDYWAVPTQIYDDQEELLEPYYITLNLPGEEKSEFVLMQPFTPRGKRNMVSWLAARCDGEHYGELILYNLPKDTNIYGPMQIEARIGQHPEITQLIAWWNQNQSRLIRGNLITIPLGNAFLYAEPFYIVSEQGQIPEVKKIILAYGERIVMGDTLEEALAALKDGTEGGSAGPPAGTKETPAQKEQLTTDEDSPGPNSAEGEVKPGLSAEDKKIIAEIEEKIRRQEGELQEIKELLKKLK
ncbi:MAG TPA: UPF0182 family protein [Firmicutes bacterium]|nr:UPF0182 family protein [Bacillota bacterium]